MSLAALCHLTNEAQKRFGLGRIFQQHMSGLGGELNLTPPTNPLDTGGSVDQGNSGSSDFNSNYSVPPDPSLTLQPPSNPLYTTESNSQPQTSTPTGPSWMPGAIATIGQKLLPSLFGGTSGATPVSAPFYTSPIFLIAAAGGAYLLLRKKGQTA